jgi:hypothetical protein
MAEIKLCHPCKDTIAAKQQDAMYGKGLRVHNQTATKQGQSPQYRCTVCGAVRG